MLRTRKGEISFPRCRKGWHALGENRKIALFHENAVSEKVRLVSCGKTWIEDCIPAVCERGLHAAKTAIAALTVNGPFVCRVKVGGRIEYLNDIFAGQEREVVQMTDYRDCFRMVAIRAFDEIRFNNKWLGDYLLPSGKVLLAAFTEIESSCSDMPDEEKERLLHPLRDAFSQDAAKAYGNASKWLLARDLSSVLLYSSNYGKPSMNYWPQWRQQIAAFWRVTGSGGVLLRKISEIAEQEIDAKAFDRS